MSMDEQLTEDEGCTSASGDRGATVEGVNAVEVDLRVHAIDNDADVGAKSRSEAHGIPVRELV